MIKVPESVSHPIVFSINGIFNFQAAAVKLRPPRLVLPPPKPRPDLFAYRSKIDSCGSNLGEDSVLDDSMIESEVSVKAFLLEMN